MVHVRRLRLQDSEPNCVLILNPRETLWCRGYVVAFIRAVSGLQYFNLGVYVKIDSILLFSIRTIEINVCIFLSEYEYGRLL